MTPKQRLLAALRGQDVDRVPWSPFLAYIWETFPQDIRDKGQRAFVEEIGGDPLFRGAGCTTMIKHDKCEITTVTEGDQRYLHYATPEGTLTGRSVYKQDGNTWFLVDHPVKTREDLYILARFHRDMTVLPDYDPFIAASAALGESGLNIPLVAMKTAMQHMIEHWVGTENLYFFFEDWPDAVEECIQSITKVNVERARIASLGPGEAFIFWEDSSTTNISPYYFEKYTLPEINEYGRHLAAEGKLLVHHACGHLKALLPLISQSNINVLESVGSPPTNDIDFLDVRKKMRPDIGLIGGIEPTFFLNCTLDELEAHVEDVLDKMGKQRFVLANSDSCPPGVSLEKFKLVSEVVRKYYS